MMRHDKYFGTLFKFHQKLFSEGKPRIRFGDGPVSSRSRFAHGFLGFCTSEKKNSELDLWARPRKTKTRNLVI